MTPPEPSNETATAEDRAAMREATAALGQTLRAVSDEDPLGTPSDSAATVFASWLQAAGPLSPKKPFFDDVSKNFKPADHTNKDLFDIFELLGTYVDMEEDIEHVPASGTFIGLTMIDPSTAADVK